MPTVCIQCAMHALLLGEPVPTFEESPDEHQRRAHPDLDAAKREHNELVERFANRRRGNAPMPEHECPQPGSGGIHHDPADTGRCIFCGARLACTDYQPDHNGECLNCDEPYEAHFPAEEE